MALLEIFAVEDEIQVIGKGRELKAVPRLDKIGLC